MQILVPIHRSVQSTWNSQHKDIFNIAPLFPDGGFLLRLERDGIQVGLAQLFVFMPVTDKERPDKNDEEKPGYWTCEVCNCSAIAVECGSAEHTVLHGKYTRYLVTRWIANDLDGNRHDHEHFP